MFSYVSNQFRSSSLSSSCTSAHTSLTQVRGRISTEGRADLNVHVQLDRPVQLDSVIVLSVRGGRPIKLPVTATAVVPTIEIPQEELDFGSVTFFICFFRG